MEESSESDAGCMIKAERSQSDVDESGVASTTVRESDVSNMTNSDSSDAECPNISQHKDLIPKRETELQSTPMDASSVNSELSRDEIQNIAVPSNITQTNMQPDTLCQTRDLPSYAPSANEQNSQDSVKETIETVGRKDVKSKAAPAQAAKPIVNYRAPLLLLSLPIDSLHFIASFLSPSEWANFGECNKGSNRICREIFRRVRMHGFRCATEIVTAWKLGQLADARELCALYIDAGVPVYPHSLGHSYHTLIWRMGIEAREMQGPTSDSQINDGDNRAERAENSGATRQPVDRFFAERYEARTREGYSYTLSYLEEKSLYMLRLEEEAQGTRGLAFSLRRHVSIGPNRFVARTGGNLPQGQALGNDPIMAPQNAQVPLFRLPSTGFPTQAMNGVRRGLTRSNSHSELRLHKPKVLIKVHRHLLDQHLLGRPSVDDNDGAMKTATISLSADFFHPHFSIRSFPRRQNASASGTGSHFRSTDGLVSGDLLPAWNHQTVLPQQAMDLAVLGGGVEELLANQVRDGRTRFHREGMVVTDDSDSDAELPIAHRAANASESLFDPANSALDADHQPPPAAAAENLAPPVLSTPTYPNVLSNVDLEVYSASSANPKVDSENPDSRELRKHLRTRFGVYQRRLDTLLAHHDSVGFEECILDFWDEFLPQTVNIHYYDRHTPVPRISRLNNFMTKPCPKAIGIVQCEIERIRISSKKKRVNMKGRFFPTYEYRLFIRHRPSEAADGSEPPRRDTILMMAKNRGRKYATAVGQPALSNSKKGANNYYLYMPQREDVDQHYSIVNGSEATSNSIPNGAGNRPLPRDGSVLVGRLQSNFIGTEFQIFTPQIRKQANHRPISRSFISPIGPSASDDEFGYDSGFSSDNGSSSRRRSRFRRLSLRRSRSPGLGTTIDERRSLDPARRTVRRSRSSDDMGKNRPTRTSRRAIANTADAPDTVRLQPTLCEEEDGAITYTANLLGSRPRIMDVCIPKVTREGVAGVEWNKYLENSDDVDTTTGNRMLNRLKNIQQRLENEEPNQGEERDGEAENSDNPPPPDNFGLLALQNRPPWWNVELGSFVLNFGGRVSVASVKNFQLCDRSDQDYIMLQFGRIAGRHSFTMDFQHPLTAVQAFAIAISSLQSKISFG